MTSLNGGRLSAQARRRLERRRRGDGEDLAMPDLADAAAVIAWRRRQHAAWGEGTEIGEPAHRSAMVADVPVLIAGPESAPTIIYLHGGGFCLGSPGTSAPITARLAAGLRVVSVDYRLAPEHLFPAALDDIETVYRRLVEASGPLVVVGDSAGGNLAVGLAIRTADRPPAALVLFCPHLDHRPRPATVALRTMRAGYIGGASVDDVLVSPLGATDAQLAAMPALLVQTTTTDPLHPQSVTFVERVAALGGDASLEVWDGLWHAWHYHRELPEAWDAIDRALGWILEGIHDGGTGAEPT